MVDPRQLRILLVAGLLASSLSAAQAPSALDKRITLDLVDAHARDVLGSFGHMMPARVELDPAIDGTLTIRLADVSIRTVLDALCDMLACEWAYEEDAEAGPTLRVQPAAAPRAERPEPGSLDTTITMNLRQAPPRMVFSSFAEILDAELVLEWGETVTIDLRDEPLARALDRVCAQLGCEWQLDESAEPRRLTIRESPAG